MFWGLVLEPEKRYSQIVKQPFHVSHAVLDVTTGDGQVCQVLLRTTGGNFIICSLQKGKDLQTPLDLYFKAGSDITFSTNGKCQVHLTGYIDPVDLEGLEEEEEEEDELDETVLSEEELVALEQESKKKKKRKLNSSAEESTSKKAKNDKQKAQNGVKNKQPSKAGAGDSDSDDSSDDEVDLQDLLEGEDVDSDEQDNSYRPDVDISGAGVGVSDEEEEDDSDDDEDDDESDDDEEEESETEQSTKQLPKKSKQENKPQLNGIEKKTNNENQQQSKKQKKKEEKKQQKEKPQQPQREKKSLSGGVHIEDLKVGSGPEVTSGKSVQVYYEGRLKSNNKMFDKHLTGPGFKFHVGSQEVIKGWDVGILGMRVGGKRKIVCPPNMAYGTKGSPPVIPPNSTLVFDVEVKRVN